MSDRDDFVELLTRFGIPYTVPKTREEMTKENRQRWDEEQHDRAARGQIPLDRDETKQITIGDNDAYGFDSYTKPIAGDKGKVDGYGGFFCTWDFDTDGRFVEVGVWE